MMGYEWTATKFLLNLFFMFLTILYFIYYGMMILTLSPNIETANILNGLIYTVWTLFTGFIVPKQVNWLTLCIMFLWCISNERIKLTYKGFVYNWEQKIATWLRWFAWGCPTLWSLYGLVGSQYADGQSKLDSGETVSEFMRDYYGFRYDFLWVVAAVLIGFTFVFASAYTFGVTAINFQRRWETCFFFF